MRQPLAVARPKLDDLGPVAGAHDDCLRVLRGLQLVEAGQRTGGETDRYGKEERAEQGQRGTPDEEPLGPAPEPAGFALTVGLGTLGTLCSSGLLAPAASLIHSSQNPSCGLAVPYRCHNLAWRASTPAERPETPRQSSGSKSSAAELMQ